MVFRGVFMTPYQWHSVRYVSWDTDNEKNTGKKSIIPVILVNKGSAINSVYWSWEAVLNS